MGREKTDSYQTIAPKHILRRDYMRVMRPKPVPGVARSIEMAPSNVQPVTAGGGLGDRRGPQLHNRLLLLAKQLRLLLKAVQTRC